MVADKQGKGQLAIYVLIAVLSWLGSGFTSYFTTNSTMNSRVSVLEVQEKDIHERLERIENKLDRMIDGPSR